MNWATTLFEVQAKSPLYLSFNIKQSIWFKSLNFSSQFQYCSDALLFLIENGPKYSCNYPRHPFPWLRGIVRQMNGCLQMYFANVSAAIHWWSFEKWWTSSHLQRGKSTIKPIERIARPLRKSTTAIVTFWYDHIPEILWKFSKIWSRKCLL